MRLLPTVRLSLETDETTSPERQMDKMSAYARMNDHELIQIGPEDYDLDVSGSVAPHDRPGLGKWLKDDRLGMWDGLIVAKLDRLTRSMLDFETLIRWLQEHDKALVCLDPQIDLSTPAGKAFAQVIVTFAEFERATIGQRVREAYQKMQRDGRYAGGQIPFGYMAVKLDKGNGWAYDADPVYGPVAAEMAERYLKFESLGTICRWLNDTGVPSPRDAMRKRNGQPMRGTAWTTATVRIVLKGPAMLGAAVHADGEAVRDDQGVIVYRAPALVSREVWDRVQARLAENRSSAKVNTSALLRVVFCVCGAPMYATTTNRPRRPADGNGESEIYAYRYYTCGEAGRSIHTERACKARRINAERLENAVSGSLLDLVGSAELVEKRVIAGRDYQEDMNRLADQIGHLSGKIAKGRATRQDVTSDQAALDRANAELSRLADLEPVPAHVEDVKTGKTFRAHWESLDTVGRNEFLRSAGVTAVASKDTLPPFPSASGPMTPLDIPRAAYIAEKGLNVAIELGNLRNMLALATTA